MKPYLILLSLLLAGCASTQVHRAELQKAHLADSQKWDQIKNLVGAPLVEKLIAMHDVDLAELAERRRNLQLEIAALENVQNPNADVKIQIAIRRGIDKDMSRSSDELALSEKMKLWKRIYTEQGSQ